MGRGSPESRLSEFLGQRESRREFLRRLGKTVAIAAGGSVTTTLLREAYPNVLPDQVDLRWYAEQLFGREVRLFYHNSADNPNRLQQGMLSRANGEVDVQLFKGQLYSKHKYKHLTNLSPEDLAEQRIESIFRKIKEQKLGVNVDIKFDENDNDEAMGLLHDELSLFDEETPLIFSGTNHEALRRIGRFRDNILVAYTLDSSGSMRSFSRIYDQLIQTSGGLNHVGVMLPWDKMLDSKSSINSYRDQGLEVATYNLNHPADFVTALDLGVYSITTDNIGFIKQVNSRM